MNLKIDIIPSLHTIPWFLELKPSSFDLLAQIAEVHSFQKGDVVFREGERKDRFYILLTGQVSIETHIPNHSDVKIFTAEPLDIIGWDSLTPIVRQRTSTAQVLSDCQLVAFNGEEVLSLCEKDHDLGFVVHRRLANIVASQLLTTSLHLYDIIMQNAPLSTNGHS